MRKTLYSALVFALVVTATALPVVAGGEALTLRVNDLEGRSGGIAALVLRTYSSRPMSQGQMCFRSRPEQLTEAGGESPFESVIAANVFSDEDDARARVSIGPGGDLVLEFISESATINSSDGPLAVIYVRLRDGLVPGSDIEVTLDPGDTFAFDEDGEPIQLAPASGELRVLGPNQPMELSASGEDTRPGEMLFLSMQTKLFRPIASGQLELRYDESLTDGTPIVWIDPRYGLADYTVNTDTPGVVLVRFESIFRLNRTPGDLITIAVPTRSDIPPGTQSFVQLVPETTFILDRNGAVIPVEYENDTFQFE